ncbi:MAG: succinate-semialdehyde dehydrogenase / glutarate-semialdehyde dehydrogenase [Thermoleophilaceae bacterium]|jgi:succinate-semialdehyde dehydrogenase/glutarate-semialdehyde dehydrogenase|nr:succinate-semialdehyde dehydrogenase / glutarate-semialdehyde dehydrogenase [Thermoleophilaceae bacterium]
MSTALKSEREQRVVEGVRKQLYIGGEWRDGAEGAVVEVEDPATGDVVAEVADGTAEDAVSALAAAHEKQAEWRQTPPRERGEILRRAWELIEERKSDLALLMTLEMGKSLKESEAEITYAGEFFRWFAEEAVRIEGRFGVAPNGAGRLLTMKQPVGPCILITPWNFPLAMGTRKIGPAVAAGCTMVMKPAKQTPLSMLALAGILEEVGLPGGVLNVITSSSSGSVMEPLIKDPRARKLSFTGSTEVGRKLIEQSADQILKVSMELGGNAPFLVFDDADVDDAVAGAVIAKMRNIGEACTAANRFHVADSVAAEFAEKLASKLEGMKVGRGTEDGVEVGPLIDGDQRDKVAELVEDATSKGAKVLVGGSARDGAGYFFDPTVLSDVPPEAELLKEEIFGPVAPVASFESEEDAIEAANNTEYGLVAYVYTRDIKRALRVCEGLETGMVGLNQGMVSNPAAPFGGVKQSGFGREGGREGIEEYLETKYVAVNL